MSKKPIKPESAIQKEILDLLNRLPYTVAWKVMQANERGVPDILCCFAGLFVGIEVKRPGGRLTALQAEQGGRIKAAKGEWIVVESAEEVRLWLGGLIRDAKGRTGLTHEAQLLEIERGLKCG